MLEIKKGNNKFFVGENEDTPLGEINYHVTEEGQLDVVRTFVSDELRGEGLAQDLLERMIKFAREENKKIIPTCPYVKRKMEANESYQDVLYKG